MIFFVGLSTKWFLFLRTFAGIIIIFFHSFCLKGVQAKKIKKRVVEGGFSVVVFF